MKRSVVCFLTGALAWGAAACSTPEAPPLLSLNGPTQAAYGRTCVQADGARTDAQDCDGQVVERAYITNRLGNSVAVVDLSERLPEILDTRADIPGVSHILVGEAPTFVATSADGNFVFVYNEVDRDISVLAVESQEELLRVPVRAHVAAMFRAAPAEGPEGLLLVLSQEAKIQRLSWSFTCDGGQAYTAGCQPQVTTSLEDVVALGDAGQVRHAELAPSQDAVWVTYAQRGYLDEWLLSPREGATCLAGGEAPCLARRVGLTYGCSDGVDNDGDGLIDAQDPQCLSPQGAEDAEGITHGFQGACADGIDNDGDGLVDAQDGGCTFAGDDSETGAAAAPACSDGVDNDGDGLVDEEDPSCMDPSQVSERMAPECSDGVDNDGDGLADDQDPDCVDGLTMREGPQGSACSDGIDNDGDGAADGDDPGCTGLEDDSEVDALAACSDGEDNDGDGLADAEDPDCFGVAGRSEVNAGSFELGPVSVDPEGQFAYVLDRQASQVLIVDLESGRLLDPTACPEGDALCRPRKDDARLGVPVLDLPTALEARRRLLRTRLRDSEDGQRRILVREQALASVASTAGGMLYVVAQERTWIQREDAEGTVLAQEEEPVSTLVLRLDQGSNSSQAAGSVAECRLTEEARERVREARGELRGAEVLCSDALLPQIIPEPVACDRGEEDCVCADAQDDATCFIDFGDRSPIIVSTRQRVGYVSNGAFSYENREAALDTYREADDFYVVSDTWTVSYEGQIAERSDGRLDPERPGWMSIGGDLCQAGVQAGDRLTITGDLLPEPDAQAGCEVFEGRDLTWRVEQVQSGALKLAVLSPEEAAALNHGADAPPLVEALPSRACFAQGLRFEVRPQGEWVVRGDDVGLLVNRQGEGAACVPRFGPEALYQHRVREGEVFENPYFSFTLEAGQVVLPQDFRFVFNTRSAFQEAQVRVGPTPSQVLRMETSLRSYLMVLDSGSNLVRVYEAKDKDELLGALF